LDSRHGPTRRNWATIRAVHLPGNTPDTFAYPGVSILSDGTIVTTTYGHRVPGEAPFVVSVRLKLSDLDEMYTRSKKQE